MKARLITLLGIGLIMLASVSCDEVKEAPPPPPPPVIVEAPDYGPVSEGWKVQSYALIGIAVIIAITLMSKSDKPTPPPPYHSRKRQRRRRRRNRHYQPRRRRRSHITTTIHHPMKHGSTIITLFCVISLGALTLWAMHDLWLVIGILIGIAFLHARWTKRSKQS